MTRDVEPSERVFEQASPRLELFLQLNLMT